MHPRMTASLIAAIGGEARRLARPSPFVSWGV